MGEQLQKKIAFFVRQGADDFLEDIVLKLQGNFEIRKVTINSNEELKLINQGMAWADISWFEWCDNLVAYGSKLPIAKDRKIICRLHSYEAFIKYPAYVNWSSVDKVIFVSENIMNYVLENFSIDKAKAVCIPNGVNMNKWTYLERQPGFKVAYVGYINYKKGAMLLLHAFKALYERDNRYKLYIAGKFQDPRDSMYFEQMIRELGLQDNYYFEDWQVDLEGWLKDKDYILCTSLLESQNMSVMQAMASGIKPIVHNFVGAKAIYPEKYVWNTIDEAVEMIAEKDYNSPEYRSYIENNYSLEKQLESIKQVFDAMPSAENKTADFDYYNYWSKRLNSRFNLEGVGYIGLGDEHNRLLYQGRLEALEAVLNIAFDNLADKRVLELGPGIGIFTEYFKDKGVKDYSGIDIVEKSVLEMSKKFPNYRFMQGDITEDIYYSGKYDLIFASSVLLHLTNEVNYEKTLCNLSNHLADAGVIILIDPITMIKTKSASAHVVIRDINDINHVLDREELQLSMMLPIAFFLNYPFDNALLRAEGKSALEAFQTVSHLFKLNEFSDEDKKLMGRYIFNREKKLIHDSGIGLSEKLLIIQKKGNPQISIDMKDVYHIESIEAAISDAGEVLRKNNTMSHPIFEKLEELLQKMQKR